MILSGQEILKQVEAGLIQIDPFNPERINPASFDLTLGDEVAIYSDYTQFYHDAVGPLDGKFLKAYGINERGCHVRAMDSKQKPSVQRLKIDPDVGWVLNPGVAYLMHTREKVYTEKYVPILDGKSSIARLFLQIHMTAGFGDPGFRGQYTLEVTSQFPVRVYPGMRICQIRFHHIEGDVVSYQQTGNYRGQLSEGPIESQAYRSAFK